MEHYCSVCNDWTMWWVVNTTDKFECRAITVFWGVIECVESGNRIEFPYHVEVDKC